MAKGSNTTAPRRRLAQAIRAAYPRADVIEAFDTPHNRIDLGQSDPLRLHYEGKRTLVLAEHNSAVRHSSEEGNCCPNYWHFSPYGFCPYGCAYCYLAGTQGVRFSPTVKVFLNLPEILGRIDKIARQIGKPTAFYLGKLQDGLALDPLTGYSRRIIPFLADHPTARLTLLSKSADVTNLLDLEHRGHSILSWTVGPRAVIEQFERNTPSLEERLRAMQTCAKAGYPVRAVVMPILPIPDWQTIYREFLISLLGSVSLARITLGSICSYPQAVRLTDGKLGPDNPISVLLAQNKTRSADGRLRFPRHVRQTIYRTLIQTIRRTAPHVQIALCLEDPTMFAALDLPNSQGRCNCVL